MTAALADGTTDAALVAGAPDSRRVERGAIARRAIGTRAERRAAHQLLYRILVKPQDNAITRYLYRPVSFPLTRLLAWTPITPNQISYLVGALVALGCWMTAHASANMAIAGTLVVLAASYLDCCDGEIARVKLLSSRFGAWIDTVIDEASSIGYMAALGIHCHLAFGRTYFGDLGFDPWLVAVGLTTCCYVWCMYCIYYNIIVAVGSANSQDYVGKFDVVPTDQPNTVKLQPKAPKAIPIDPNRSPIVRFIATYGPYVVRRDFISWAATFLAIAHLTQLSFICQVAAGVIADAGAHARSSCGCVRCGARSCVLVRRSRPRSGCEKLPHHYRCPWRSSIDRSRAARRQMRHPACFAP